jgi:hypothetical protein
VAQYFEEKAESRPSIRPAPVRSQYKGVYPLTQRTPTGLKTLWSAEVFEKYDRVVLGVFSSEEEARTVYQQRMRELDPSTTAAPTEDEKVLRRVVLRERADAERKLAALSARKSVNTEKIVTEEDGKSVTESVSKTETETEKGNEELERAVKKEKGDEEKENGDSNDHSAASLPIAHVKADATEGEGEGEMKEGMEEMKEEEAKIVSEKEEKKVDKTIEDEEMEETSKEEKVKAEGTADSTTPKEREEGEEEEEEEADDHSMDSQDSDSLLATSEEDDDEVLIQQTQRAL